MAEPSKEDWQALLDKLRQRGTPSPAVAVAEPTGAPNPCMACEPKQLEQCGVFCRYQQASFAAIEARGVPVELRQPVAVVREYAEKLPSHLAAGEGLVLRGPVGTLKTTLAVAVLQYCLQLGERALFLTMPSLIDSIFSAKAVSPEDWLRFESRLRQVPLLVLDDLGAHNATNWAADKLFQIVDYRYIRKLPTVVTTNLDLEDLDDRIRSRLQDPDLVTCVRITAPDYRSPVRDLHDPLLYQLQMLSDRSFGNFSLREPENLSPEVQLNLEKVFRAAQEFAEQPRGWLVMTGTYGCGKTHLAAAIGNFRKGMGDKPVFVVVPDLLDHLRATFSPSSSTSYDELFNRVKSAQILVLDDLGTQSATPWAREKLYQIFNERYNAKLPTVITMSCNLEDLDARIRSRMLDTRVCKIYEILAPSFRSGNLRPETNRRKRGS